MRKSRSFGCWWSPPGFVPDRSRGATAAAAALLLALAGCGSDDDTTSTTTTSTTTTVAAEEAIGGFPSDEFCTAQAHLETAQDGAQRNTAIGEMQNAWGDDAPAEIVDALDTLLEGDLTPERYIAAERALVEVCG